MSYLIEVRDRPGCEQIRKDFQQQHLDYLDSKLELLLAAGGLLNKDGTAAQGGLFIPDVDDCSASNQFIFGDPFMKAGLFEIVQITRWRKGYLNKERLIESL